MTDQAELHPAIVKALEGGEVLMVDGSAMTSQRRWRSFASSLDGATGVVCRQAYRDITFPSGGRIRFIGGSKDWLGEKIRGLSLDAIYDPGEWLSRREVFFALRARNGTYNGEPVA